MNKIIYAIVIICCSVNILLARMSVPGEVNCDFDSLIGNVSADNSNKNRVEKILEWGKHHYDNETPYSMGSDRWEKARDCSSMTQDLYKNAEIKFPLGCRTMGNASQMYNAFEDKIPATQEGLKALKQGDTLYFTRNRDGVVGIGHVATVIENPSSECGGYPKFFHTNKSPYPPHCKCLTPKEMKRQKYAGGISLQDVINADGKPKTKECKDITQPETNLDDNNTNNDIDDTDEYDNINVGDNIGGNCGGCTTIPEILNSTKTSLKNFKVVEKQTAKSIEDIIKAIHYAHKILEKQSKNLAKQNQKLMEEENLVQKELLYNQIRINKLQDLINTKNAEK